MSIEKLEEISEEFVDREDSRWMDNDDCLVIYKFMQETIATLKAQSAYPMAENKHRALLNNCVDGDKAILHEREIEGDTHDDKR